MVPVIERLNVLADNLYGEVVLYQSMGDSVKAMERINKILTNAPPLPRRRPPARPGGVDGVEDVARGGHPRLPPESHPG